MGPVSRRRLALVVAVALVLAMTLPSTVMANGSGRVAPAAVVAASYFAPDAYESADDTWTTAPVLPETSLHTFESSSTDWMKSNDNDWFKVTVTASGTPVFIDAMNIQQGHDLDLWLEVFTSDGSGVCSTTALASIPGAPQNDETAHDADQDDDWGLGGYDFPGSWVSDAPLVYFVTPAPGTYYFRLMYHHANSDQRDFVAPWATTAGSYELHVVVGDAHRISGADRYGTDLALVKQMWNGNDPDWWIGPHGGGVIIASGANYPDALSAGVMSLLCGMPLILTPPAGMTDDIREEIRTLAGPAFWNEDPFSAFIIGGTAAVSPAVETELKSRDYITRVTRVAGTNRYGTAVAVANATSETVHALRASTTLDTGDVSESRAFLVSGANFADALSAGPVAAWGSAPILLTAPTAASSETVAWMQSHNTTDIIVCGGTSAVSTAVLDAIQAAVPGTQVFTRLGGADRYETSYKVAQHGVRSGWTQDGHAMEGSACVVVSGANFPDGLAAAQLTYFWWSPMLLSQPTTLSPWVQKYYEDNDGFSNGSFVVGGPSAISAATYGALRDMWKKPF